VSDQSLLLLWTVVVMGLVMSVVCHDGRQSGGVGDEWGTAAGCHSLLLQAPTTSLLHVPTSTRPMA
jgi:hypothetical protein